MNDEPWAEKKALANEARQLLRDATALRKDSTPSPYFRGLKEGRAEAVELCARLVEAAGCSCISLWIRSGKKEKFDGVLSPDTMTVRKHDHRCPQALAARLRGDHG